MVSVHAVSFAHDQGVGLAGASLALTAYGIGAVGGRLAAGALSDRFGTAPTMRAAYLVEMLSLAGLLWVPSRGALLAALLLFGAGFAASDTMLVRAVPDVFGTRAVGAVIGVLSLGWRCGAALGPAAAGFLHDLTGSYTLPFAAGPAAALASWILFALATSRPKRAA
jgi:MFS family permease